VTAAWVLELLWSAGQFKTITPHFSGQTRTISGVIGAEDITINPRTGIAYISSCDRRAINKGKPGHGAIFAYNLNDQDPDLCNLTPEADPDFQPHGISLYIDDNNRETLFVINHQGHRNQIDIFDLKNDVLVLRQSLTAPCLISPNDLLAVGPDQVYVTNDHKYSSGYRQVIENYFKLRLSNVVFFDGSKWDTMASSLGYANGINMSKDKKTLYVSATTERTLHVYDRDPKSNELKARTVLPLHSGVDNIELDMQDGLWIGSHPQLLKFMKHADNPDNLSPSQVLHLIPDSKEGFRVEEVYLNAGDELSGSSVAAVWKKRMLIGSVFEPVIIECTMNSE
jgi:arylesterase/paraoxonase